MLHLLFAVETVWCCAIDMQQKALKCCMRADSRMRQAATGRGMELTSRSRPLTPADLSDFEYIIGMDASNLAAIQVPGIIYICAAACVSPLSDVFKSCSLAGERDIHARCQ